MVRLQPGVYLNDNLVNFYLDHLQRAGSRVHVFSSYFYTRIVDLVASGQKSTPEFRLYLWENLKRWIKNVDIWGQDILLIPIHGSLHWSVVAVFHPGSLLLVNVDGRIPCLLHLDSGKCFRLHRSATLFNHIRIFLRACLEQKDETLPFADSAKSMQGLSPPVPAQPNETDCGIHMLEWIERLLENSLQVTQEFLDAKGNMPPYGKGAFDQMAIDGKRHHLQSLIYTLSQGDISGICACGGSND
jgi:Ulp1 family protease